MTDRPEDVCPRPESLPNPPRPLSAPIYLSSVYRCDSPDEADRMLGGELAGYVYQRDGHPNADLLAEKCRRLHGAERAAITASGMGAMSLFLLSQLAAGDHLVVSHQLYGRSLELLTRQSARLGVTHTLVDTCDLAATAAAITPATRWIVVETITNPVLRVSDIATLADLAHGAGARLLVDNTFASPVVCRPLDLGADLVLESLTKIMNGHSDITLGLLCGPAARWEQVPGMLSTWGLASSPFDCWLAMRGLATLAMRADWAGQRALELAGWLETQPAVACVHYPGLDGHRDHALAKQQFAGRYGAMVTFDLAGGLPAAERFIAASRQIPFCPSLGEVATTLSHPASTSHRAFSPEQQRALAILPGTIRLSVGAESSEQLQSALAEGLAAL